MPASDIPAAALSGHNDPFGLEELTAIRRDLHAHPELGFEEVRTSQIVADFLAAQGIEVHRGLGGTGVVGTLRVGEGTGRIALRADMDALAMPEQVEERPYASLHPGRMHACGHDGHTTMLLGAARHLARTRNFSGTVHFVFQPAEEGVGGAAAMMRDGLFDLFPVDRIFGMHNMPGIPVDEMAVAPGPQLAAADRWEVTFTGVGAHGARPHLGRDPVAAAAVFLTALQTVVSRNVDPLEPAVISACALAAGDFLALNVIPDTARVGGTARCYSHEVRGLIEEGIHRVARGVAEAQGVSAEVTYTRGVPPVINDAAAAAAALKAARGAFGAARVADHFTPITAAEDFAFYLEQVPGAFVFVGNGPAEDGALHHNTRFDFNDAAIGTGVRFWTALVEAELAGA